MSNMKFAIRNFAVACVLPATFVQGPLASIVLAQNVPSAISKTNPASQFRRTTPRKSAPAAVPSNDIQFTPSASANQSYNSIRPVAGPARQGAAPAGETEVQRELRMLYENAGQEMPAMSLDEMDIPEPQPGVNPGVPGGAMQPGARYAQPPVAPQKTPNIFERIFLGKKMPTAVQQRQLPPRPFIPGGNPVRFGQPGTPMPPIGTQPRVNYRPYQTGQQGAAPPSQAQSAPGQNQPARNPQAVIPPAVPQPNQTAVPVIPPAEPNELDQDEVTESTPLDGNAASATPELTPKIDDDADESLDIEITPKNGANGNSTPAKPDSEAAAPNSEPAAGSDSPVSDQEATGPDAAATETSIEANPFSGLKLSVPEGDAAAKSAQPQGEPAQSTARNASDDAVEDDNPFEDSDEQMPEEPPQAAAPKPVAKPNTEAPVLPKPSADVTKRLATPEPIKPAVAKPAVAPPTVVPPAVTKSAEPPNSNSGSIPSKVSFTPKSIEATSQAAKPEQPKPIERPAAVKPTAKQTVSDRLKLLANSPEKTGLKGFCPVALRQSRMLIVTKPQFTATYQGQKYSFSSAEAKAAFEKSPELYAPAHKGHDAVLLLDDDKPVPGTLDYSAWFQGRLYLFSTRQNLDEFNRDPENYLEDEEDLEIADEGPKKGATAPASNGNKESKAAQLPDSAGKTGLVAKPISRSNPPAPSDLPVLSDNLDDVQPIAPVEEKAVPKTIAPAIPKSTPVKVKPNTNPSSASKSAVGNKSAPATLVSMPPANTAKKASPKLISPDLRATPATLEP